MVPLIPGVSFLVGIVIGGLFSILETQYAIGMLLIFTYFFSYYLKKKLEQVGVLETLKSLKGFGLDYQSILNQLLFPKKETKIRKFSRMLLVTYYYQGKEYHQAIPLDPKNRTQNRVKLAVDQKKVDITQYPGTKYPTASELGGERYL